MSMQGINDSCIYKRSLRPFRLLMCLLGIVPFNCCQPKSDTKSKSLRSVLWRLLYTATTVVLLTFTSMKRQQYSNSAAYDNTDDLSSLINTIGYWALVIVHLIVQIESTWKTSHYRFFFIHCERMRARLVQDLGVPFVPSAIQLNCGLLYVLFVACVVLVILLTIVQGIASVTLMLYSEMVLKMKLIEFCMFAVVVQALLLQLQSAAVKFTRELNVARFEAWPQRKRCLARIAVLQDLHAELWDCMRCIEHYFEWSLSGLMLKIFLDVTLKSYWVYQSFDYNTADELKIYCIGFMLIQFVILTTACTLCSICEVVQKRFRKLFHSISFDRNNVHLASCLRLMCLQLTHEHFHFSAGGFVDMNMETLGSFTFSVITFIVILIQFRMTF